MSEYASISRSKAIPVVSASTLELQLTFDVNVTVVNDVKLKHRHSLSAKDEKLKARFGNIRKRR